VSKMPTAMLNKILLFALSLAVAIFFGLLTVQSFTITLALALAILIGLFLVEKPHWGIIFALLSILVGQLFRIPYGEGGGIVLSDILLPVIVLIYFWRLIYFGKIPKSPLTLPLLWFIIIALVGLLATLSIYTASENLVAAFYLFRLIIYTLFFYVVLAEDKSYQFLDLLFWIGFGFAVAGLVQYFIFPDLSKLGLTGWDPHFQRVFSTFLDPNFAGGFLAILILLATSLWFYGFWKDKILRFAVFVPVYLAAFYLTYSRSSYLALALGLLILGLIKARRIVVILFAAALIFFSIVPFEKLPERFQERLSGITSLDLTAQARLKSWQLGGKILEDHLWLGTGYNHLYSVKAEYDKTVAPGHSAFGFDSSFLTIAVGTGILGIIPFILLYIIIFYQAVVKYKKGKPLQQGMGLAMIAIIPSLVVHSTFVNSLLYPQLMIVLWYLAGLLYKNPKLKSQMSNETQSPNVKKFGIKALKH